MAKLKIPCAQVLSRSGGPVKADGSVKADGPAMNASRERRRDNGLDTASTYRISWRPCAGVGHQCPGASVRAPSCTHPNGAYDMLHINEDQVGCLLSMNDALRGVEQAFSGLGTGRR